MPRGKPGNPHIHKIPLEEAAHAVKASVKNLTGHTVTDNVAQRIAERVVRTYLIAKGVENFGSRMKDTTVAIMELEVGRSIEVEANCKANLHGQFKSIRRRTNNEDLKWRVEQIKPGLWRVERRGDGSYNKGKSPTRNPKAVWLASIPINGHKVFEGEKAFEIINDFTKNKARAVLDNNEAEWKAKTIPDGIQVTRIR